MSQEIPHSTAVRQMQVIAAAIIGGACVFAVFAVLFVTLQNLQPAPTGQLISLFMAGLAAINLVMAVVIANRITHAAQMQGAKLVEAWRTRLLVKLALCEGASLGNSIALLVEHQWWTLMIIVGLIFSMLQMFPTQRQLDHFLEAAQMLMTPPDSLQENLRG